MPERLEAREAVHGQRMVEVRVRFWTNDIAKEKGKDEQRLKELFKVDWDYGMRDNPEAATQVGAKGFGFGFAVGSMPSPVPHVAPLR